MPRLRFRAAKSPSRLEDHFLILWKASGGAPLEREYRFHDKRRWRADFAHLQTRCRIEVEDGIWVNGRHNRTAGFKSDLEFLSATDRLFATGKKTFRSLRQRWRVAGEIQPKQ